MNDWELELRAREDVLQSRLVEDEKETKIDAVIDQHRLHEEPDEEVLEMQRFSLEETPDATVQEALLMESGSKRNSSKKKRSRSRRGPEIIEEEEEDASSKKLKSVF